MRLLKFIGLFVALLIVVVVVYDVFFFEPPGPYTEEEARVEAEKSLAYYCRTSSRRQYGEELDCSMFGPPEIRIMEDGSAFVIFPMRGGGDNESSASEYGVIVYLGADGAYTLSPNLPFTTWGIKERKER